MYNVSPSAREPYYLRMLLTKCKGCKSFEDLKLLNGFYCETFKATCIARGLVESDEEWTTHVCRILQLRILFATVLLFL